MKIRNGFVTNSSSSSFIISKKHMPMDKDFLFNLIVSLYKNVRESMIGFMPIASHYNMFFNEESNCFEFFDEIALEKEWEIRELVEKVYNFDTYESLPAKEEWMNFDSYTEYEAYWVNKINQDYKKEKKNIHAPFSIVDFENDSFYYPVERGVSWGKTEVEKVNAPFLSDKRDISGWYINCSYSFDELSNKTIEEFISSQEYCDGCALCQEECHRLLNGVKNKEINENNATSLMLGNLCINSECGYIPRSVVDKLGKLCDYWCNHMG